MTDLTMTEGELERALVTVGATDEFRGALYTVAACGVPAALLREVAHAYARGQRLVAGHAMRVLSETERGDPPMTPDNRYR